MDTTAKAAFRKGDLVTARRLLPTESDLRPDQCERLAAINYLEGNYAEAITQLASLLPKSRLNRLRRHRINRQLSLAYFQTNQFELAAALELRDPLTKLMRSFADTPNLVDWNGQPHSRIPFLQEASWELPRIELAINGQPVTAKIDTGGDLMSIPWNMADSLGIRPVATATGRFAAGSTARVGWSQVEHIEVGGVGVTNVPISLNEFEHPVVGTGFLRQFRSTLDYPGHQLVLQPKGTSTADTGVPFLIAGTHLMIVAGSISGRATRLLVDSGLEADNGASVLAAESTLHQAGIVPSPPARGIGDSGAGKTPMKVGTFAADEVSIGDTTRSDLIGLTGIFPKQLARVRTLGFPLGGLVSHNFLRHYRWTLDFSAMSMTLEPPHPAS